MKNYRTPNTEEKLFQMTPFFAQYGLTPDCSSNISNGECIDTEANHPLGGAFGYSCFNNVIDLFLFAEGAADRSHFPCKVLINGSSSEFTLDDTIVTTCSGNAGIVYLLNVNVSDCLSVESVQVECESTENCAQVSRG